MSNPEKPRTFAATVGIEEYQETLELVRGWMPTWHRVRQDIDEAFESAFKGGDSDF